MKPVRVGIMFLLVFAVAAHGAVEDWARAVLAVGAGVLLVLWSVCLLFEKENGRVVILTPLLTPFFAFVLVVVAQLGLHRSVSAFETRQDLILVMSCLILLFLAAQSFRAADHWRSFLWFLMSFGFLVSIFGILQQLTFNGKLYWFRDMRYGGIPFGPYVNRNHFAGFAELVIPVALVPLVLGKVRKERWFAAGLFALVTIGALFLSASRGGIVSFSVELGVMIFIVVARRAAGKHALAGGIILLLALVMVTWTGVHQVLDRFSSLQVLEVTVGKRASMRQDAWRIFLDYPVLGAGLGTLQTVFPAYDSLYDGKVVNHAHNDYLEALAETGVAGALCCAAFLVLLFSSSLKRLLVADNSFEAALHLSGLVGCSGFLVHGLVDFNLHIPANALLFFLMALLATWALPAPPRPSVGPVATVNFSENFG